MKTLTTTFHHTTNYGAVLQSYALQHTILKLGHDNEILEIEPSQKKVKERTSLILLLRRWYMKYLSFKRCGKVETLQNHFKNFHINHLRLTKPYHNMDELRNDSIIQEICKLDHETGRVFVYSEDGTERELSYTDVSE